MWQKIRVQIVNGKLTRIDNNYKLTGTDVRFVKIPLNEYDVDVTVAIGKTPSQICKENNADFGGNCCFAWLNPQKQYLPIGNLVKNGVLLRQSPNIDKWADFVVPMSGKPYIGQINVSNVKNIKLSFSGTAEILRAGVSVVKQATQAEGTPTDVLNMNPRTLIGIDKAGDALIYAVVDGRSKTDTGLSLEQSAVLMAYLGAYSAINLDGGGSCSFYVKTEGKSINYQVKEGERATSSAIIFKKKAQAVSTVPSSIPHIIDAKLTFTQSLQKNNNTHEYIIIHHALAKHCTVQDIHKWHLENKWIGIGYHFFVAKDGKIYQGRNINWQGGHCKEQLMNIKSIGICLEGCYEDYENQTDKVVPQEQLKALETLVQYLMKQYKIPKEKVKKHNYFANYKKCCGNYFPWDNFIKEL